MAFVLGQLIDVQQLAVVPGDALEAELQDFLDAIRDRRDPAVTGEHGLRALDVAERVVARVENSLGRARGSA
jgi:predicted dehydrogenase